MALDGISNADLADLIATTTKNLPKMRLEHTFEYQHYEVLDRWFQRDKTMIGSGTSIQRNIILDSSGNARHVRLYQETTVNVVDLQSQLDVPWRQAKTQWSVDRREAKRNSAPSAFVGLVKGRRDEAMISLADLLEERAWQSPDDSSDDLNPYGIPYYIPKLASGAGEGFYGGSDTNFAATTAGIDPATSGDNTTSIAGGKPKWRSYCAGGTGYYESINATALRTLLLMFLKINFQSPFVVKDLTKGPKSNYRIYCNAETYVAFVELARQQNDQIGADLARYNGLVVFNRVPIIHIPYLDNDSTADPIYLVNHNMFMPFVQKGEYFRESEPMNDRHMPDVHTTFVDLSYNFLCLNRRRQGVMSKI